MASTTDVSIRLKFLDSDGKSVQFTYADAKTNVLATDVTAAMNGIITNRSIFNRKPVTIKGADLVTRTVTDIDLS